MAHSLYIVYSGGTVNLNSGNIRMLTEYVPRMGDGDKVTDSVELEFSGTATSDIQAAVLGVQRAMADAVRFQNNKMGDRVFVYHQPIGYASAYRSELVQANSKEWRLELDDDTMGKARWEDAFKVKGLLVWKRSDWWENPDYTMLATTNALGAGGTVTNDQNEAGTASFYLAVAGTAITGDVASPVTIRYKNATNDAAEIGAVYIGHYAEGFSDTPSADSLMFQGTATADAGCSGGAYTALSFAGTVEANMISWAIPSAEVYRGRSYKMIARFKDAPAFSDLYLKAKLMTGSSVIGETRWQLTTAGQQLQPIGSMKVMPQSGVQTAYSDVTLALYSKRAGGAGTINFDYLVAMPQDSWQSYSPISGLGYDETIVNIPTDNQFYSSGGGSAFFTHFVDEGEPIKLVPGVDNTLYFLHSTTGGSATINRTSHVALVYHPRRRTI